MLSETLETALSELRVGNYTAAARVLRELPGARGPLDLRDHGVGGQILLLRLITLRAEIADHFGRTSELHAILKGHEWILKDLIDVDRDGGTLTFKGRTPAWRFRRQQIYYLWLWSVHDYRTSHYAASRERLERARRLAEKLEPRAQGLLAQIYYGLAKIALHDSQYTEATSFYRQSLLSAAEVAHYRQRKSDDRNGNDVEIRAAQYTTGKALALGLAQCLREQGRLDEAYTSVVAGKVLLDLSADQDLAQHARLLLGSIERGAAGRKDVALLASARAHLEATAAHFKDHRGDVWFRSRYELALALMQQGHNEEAREMITAALSRARKRKDPKWIANANLALSRIERHAGRLVRAETAAREARNEALNNDLRKIIPRARIALARALYDVAVDDRVPDMARLKQAEEELADASEKVALSDLRNRAAIALLQARVHHAKKEEMQAVEAYRRYGAMEHFVEVGRVKELAELVHRELYPLTTFHCPADEKTPRYDFDLNLDEMARHVIRKVDSLPITDPERAHLLGMSGRQHLHRVRQRLGLKKPD